MNAKAGNWHVLGLIPVQHPCLLLVSAIWSSALLQIGFSGFSLTLCGFHCLASQLSSISDMSDNVQDSHKGAGWRVNKAHMEREYQEQKGTEDRVPGDGGPKQTKGHIKMLPRTCFILWFEKITHCDRRGENTAKAKLSCA